MARQDRRVSVVNRLDRFQRRHPVLGFPIAVLYKFFDDAGGYLASMLAYYAFVSLFPSLLLLATTLSIVLRNRPDLQERILTSALSTVPVIGSAVTSRTWSGSFAGSINEST